MAYSKRPAAQDDDRSGARAETRPGLSGSSASNAEDHNFERDKAQIVWDAR